ncbi:unnamed protein product [Ceutorhynchus assimilis]|uniref:Single-pass membrane and coiled-coil domain-containing protein 4 homolog n=1 Tax=Ceutorhynchus assimilis TaxID=467358 RepID=A0A9P0GND2_9CUCU|nr:unnamed protein product [Ceutorhynchus assimilis]
MPKALKGGKPKVTSKEKQKLKKEYQETQKQLKTIVFPALAVVFLFIVAYVYMKTRPLRGNFD